MVFRKIRNFNEKVYKMFFLALIREFNLSKKQKSLKKIKNYNLNCKFFSKWKISLEQKFAEKKKEKLIKAIAEKKLGRKTFKR